jgi:hypothetical protein
MFRSSPAHGFRTGIPLFMSEHFCTYFDDRYAPKGLAMWRSLKARTPSAVLHVLCLSEPCREILAGLELSDVLLYSLADLEAQDPELLRARENRSLIEYYFTLTPCALLYVLRTRPEIARLTYVDADLFFFADPQPLFDEMGDCAVGLIEHKFPAELAHLEQYGRFNVGWLTFRRDPVAFACLDVWRQQCLEWCYDRLEDNRFAEQKYLDAWPCRFQRVAVIQHKGANVAPWNLNRYPLAKSGETLFVGDQPMLFFHAHGFKPGGPGRPTVLNVETYHVEPTSFLWESVFWPYQNALIDATRQIALPLALSLTSDSLVERQLSAVDADRASRLQAIGTLQKQLEVSEADRAARLDALQTLNREVERIQADGAARLEAIQLLRASLDSSEGDRAARLKDNQALHAALQASEADRAARLQDIQALHAALEASDADRAARLQDVQTLHAALEASGADGAVRLQDIQALHAALEASGADAAARLGDIHALHEALAASEADRAARLTAMHELRDALQASESDRAAQGDVVRNLEKELENSAAERASRLAVIDALQTQLEASQAEGIRLTHLVRDLEHQLAARAAALERMAADLAHARTRLRDIERSRSWRWTQVLRRAGQRGP